MHENTVTCLAKWLYKGLPSEWFYSCISDGSLLQFALRSWQVAPGVDHGSGVGVHIPPFSGTDQKQTFKDTAGVIGGKTGVLFHCHSHTVLKG